MGEGHQRGERGPHFILSKKLKATWEWRRISIMECVSLGSMRELT
jgi:hypothetical protein